jgi:hypothetical protein
MSQEKNKAKKLLNACERRRTSAAHRKEHAPTWFDLGGQRCEALMVDVSHGGAQFQMELQEEPECGLREGMMLTYAVRTPYGEGTFTGEVRWLERLDDQLHWGVKITSMPDSPDHPIRALMDTPF